MATLAIGLLLSVNWYGNYIYIYICTIYIFNHYFDVVRLHYEMQQIKDKGGTNNIAKKTDCTVNELSKKEIHDRHHLQG